MDPASAACSQPESGSIRLCHSEQIAASFFFLPDRSPVMKSLEVRFDPLLGTSSSFAEGVVLPKAEGGCTFSSSEFPTPPAHSAQIESRSHSQSVGSNSPRRTPGAGRVGFVSQPRSFTLSMRRSGFSRQHWLALNGFTPQRLFDNLSPCCVSASARFMLFRIRKPRTVAYNMNYLSPSAVLPHPHAQVYLDPHPTTLMRLRRERRHRLLERQWPAVLGRPRGNQKRPGMLIRGPDWPDRVDYSFCSDPLNEARAVIAGCETFLDLTEDDLNALSRRYGSRSPVVRINRV